MKLKSQSGSALISVIFAVIILSIAVVSILDLALAAHKLAFRNEARAQARTVAESEMEYVYYQVILQMLTAVPAANVPNTLVGICDVYPFPTAPIPTTVRDAFLKVHRDQGWKVKRSIQYESSITGVLPNSTKTGTVSYVSVRIEVTPGPNNPFYGTSFTMRVGRRFEASVASIFQYGIFFQGDLEMSPGGDVTINGDIAANGSIYMAATRKPDGTMGTLLVEKQVRYLAGDYFNQTPEIDPATGLDVIDPATGKDVLMDALYKPGTPPGGLKNPPIFANVGADQTAAKAAQLEPMNEPENLVGGVDVQDLVQRRPDLFSPTGLAPTASEMDTALNNVYRSLIVPPPGQTTEYPPGSTALGDDPTIAVQRIYNRAGLIITVNTDNSYSITKVDPVTQAQTTVTTAFTGVVTGVSTMHDEREGQDIPVTTIDVGALATKIASTYSDFNGVLYVNVMGSTSTSPKAVRLTDAASVPNGLDPSATAGTSNGKGFSVATNGGMYVQGNYNTTTRGLADGSTQPALLMADAVTLLSGGWDDSNSAKPIANRVASSTTTLNAGVLTGNTSATASVPSGGAQNLIRYLEDWTGKDVVLNGSLGRLFDSRSFTSAYQQPGDVYLIPNTRNFVFDSSLQNHPPAGGPTTTAFNRGTFFIW